MSNQEGANQQQQQQQRRAFNILVAEDESFQRLALLDILSLCDYEAVAVQDGRQALAELKNPKNNFDLVLLDLFMPEMDGFELLSIMQDDERLRRIPVVVMSASESNELIANCLQLGVKDYLVKPIRVQQTRSLISYMSKTKVPVVQQKEEVTGLRKYEKLRPIGQGAAGSVSLYRCRTDGLQYALKEINLNFLSEKDQKNAQNEVQFLRVLRGPTIVRFYESFSENNNIYIVMEYAEGGNLAQAIQRKIALKKRFDTADILRYISQIVLAIMAMHNKNILHRDIKTQNIFITKNDILKLGDFGISRELETLNQKAQTSCGTPYFMPPEVCLGRAYNSKADVWAIGIILYELITLRKPFDSDTINGVLNQIVKVQYEPLTDDTDPSLKMLVAALLNKDYNKRPTIVEIARIPCIRKEIQKFIEDNDCMNEVMDLDLPGINNNPFGDALQEDTDDQLEQDGDEQEEDNENGEQPQVAVYMVEMLEEWAEIMRSTIRIQDYKNGWFGKHTRCCMGGDIYEWLLDKAEPDPKKAKVIGQKMLEMGLITSVEGKHFFSLNDLYKFYFDSETIADNLIRKWKQECRDPLEVSHSLVNKIEEVYSQSINEDEDSGHVIDVEVAMHSTEYKSYINCCCELEKIDITNLNLNDKISFFLNVYQCMYIHSFLLRVNEGRDPSANASYLTKLKNYVSDYTNKPFYYNIGGTNYQLDEIKHGMLRSNARKPGCLMRSLSPNDEKRNMLGVIPFDNRVLFVCLDFPDYVEHIDTFSGNVLDQCLDLFVCEILNAKVQIDLNQGEITIPRVFETYRDQFGSTDEAILQFVFKYLDNPTVEEERVINEVCVKKSMLIHYE